MDSFKNSIDKHNKVFKSLHLLSKKIENAIDICTISIQNKNKIIICGNGGSASDAQHLAAEFIGRFTVDRKSLPAISPTISGATPGYSVSPIKYAVLEEEILFSEPASSPEVWKEEGAEAFIYQILRHRELR